MMTEKLPRNIETDIFNYMFECIFTNMHKTKTAFMIIENIKNKLKKALGALNI